MSSFGHKTKITREIYDEDELAALTKREQKLCIRLNRCCHALWWKYQYFCLDKDEFEHEAQFGTTAEKLKDYDYYSKYCLSGATAAEYIIRSHYNQDLISLILHYADAPDSEWLAYEYFRYANTLECMFENLDGARAVFKQLVKCITIPHATECSDPAKRSDKTSQLLASANEEFQLKFQRMDCRTWHQRAGDSSDASNLIKGYKNGYTRKAAEICYRIQYFSGEKLLARMLNKCQECIDVIQYAKTEEQAAPIQGFIDALLDFFQCLQKRISPSSDTYLKINELLQKTKT